MCIGLCEYVIPPSLLALHAVEDETQEDEGVVAVESVHVLHHPLT